MIVVRPCPFCGLPAARTKRLDAVCCERHTLWLRPEEWEHRADTTDILDSAALAALVAIATPRVSGSRCRWCRNRSVTEHRSPCPTVVASAALRGVPPKPRKEKEHIDESRAVDAG